MIERTIPNTSLKVSPLCLGTMTFGTPVGEKDAIDIVQRALGSGINFIDTANMYEGYNRYIGSPGGVAEEILGKALKGRRDQAVLATKVGMVIGPNPDDGGLSPKHILRECDNSLKRLATDRIDLYYMHKPDPDTPVEESIEAFMGLIKAGKVKHWGISNYSAKEVRRVLQICDDNSWQRPVAHQPPYSLLSTGIEKDLLPLCREEKIGVVPYRVLEGGLLTGKYTDPSAPSEGTRAAEKPDWVPMLKDSSALAELEKIAGRAKAQSLRLFDYVIRTTAGTTGITSIILGIKRFEQLEKAIQALG